MRINEPVTAEEYVLPDGEVIITQTDPQSRITYANPAFLHTSGFSLEECLGEPQNLVRHPDMPREAFADLWRTIRRGKPWTGIVKNRRKSGAFYWVRANVTPIVESGRVTGFMSVRVKPSPEELSAAQVAYAAIRAGKARHLRLEAGQVRDVSLKGRIASLAALPLSTGTRLVVGFMGATFAALALTLVFTGGRLEGAAYFAALGGCGLGCLVALLNVLYIESRVVAPTARLADAVNRLVGGDVSARFATEGDPEIAGLALTLRQLAAKVSGVLKDTQVAVRNMNGAVDGIVEANGNLSNRTHETAASLEETAASIEQLTATVTRNTENAREANRLAARASEVTTEGGAVVGEVAATMSGISSSSKRISDIVGIIDGIAFQTNLLALNASVEAARAGEQGRGFAVVAQEVRSLAQRSSAAAQEIRGLITESVATVERGTQLATRAEQTMQDVVGSVRHVAELIAGIELASREQSAGIEQINQAVMQMDQITQRNAEMAQDTQQTAQELQRQSAAVLQAVSAFSIQKSAGPPPVTRAARGAPSAGDRDVAAAA